MRLIGYLLTSYIAAYAVHTPVHGVRHSFIPAAVPWAIAAAVAIWCSATRRSLRIAWLTLLGACIFFLLPHVLHIMPHG